MKHSMCIVPAGALAAFASPASLARGQVDPTLMRRYGGKVSAQ